MTVSRTPEYQAWRNAKKRCLNPNDPRYADYGGRGIAMAPEWRDDFPAFLATSDPGQVRLTRSIG